LGKQGIAAIPGKQIPAFASARTAKVFTARLWTVFDGRLRPAAGVWKSEREDRASEQIWQEASCGG